MRLNLQLFAVPFRRTSKTKKRMRRTHLKKEVGAISTCPKCGEPVADKFARVVGFYTPVSSYSKIRRQEFDARKWYNLDDNILG